MTGSYQQSLADAGSENQPPILENGSYVPWASRFMRYVDGKKKQGKMIRDLNDNGPYVMKQMPGPTSPTNSPRTKIQTEADLTKDEKKRFEVVIDAMNMILLGIPNYIYNSVDACQTAKAMWSRVKRLMQGTELSQFRLTNEFDKFSVKPFANTYDNPSYSRSSQSYYVTHPSLVHDYDDDYQGDVQGNDQEDKLSTTMMLLAQEITQHFSTSTNNRLCNSSNTKNQAVIQDGRVDIQSKNVGYAGNGNRNSGRIVRNQGNNVRNGFVQKNDGNAENVQRNPRTISNSGKIPTVQEHMLLAKKDEAEIHLDDEENDFMLMSASGDEQLEELNASVIMMARIQPANNDSDVEPTYTSDFVNELDAYESLIKNVQIEAENQCMVNKEMKRKNALITKNLEPYKERKIETLEKEKGDLQNRILEEKGACLKLKNDRDSLKQTFKQKEDKYLDEIITLEEKIKDHERIVFKMYNVLGSCRHVFGFSDELCAIVFIPATNNGCTLKQARRGVGGGGVTIWLSPILIGAVNSVLLLPKIMELVGLGYFGWLVYQYLLFKDPVTWIELCYSISGDGSTTAFAKDGGASDIQRNSQSSHIVNDASVIDYDYNR
ncbi:integrase, catalytic region, zinc finger, CCHC-type containing protein [Tanacetum coccineum]